MVGCVYVRPVHPIPGLPASRPRGGGTGRGTVRIAPGSTQCTFNGIVADDDCSATFSQPTEVTLTATPQLGSTFGGWTADGCSSAHLTCTFTLSAAKTVSVNSI